MRKMLEREIVEPGKSYLLTKKEKRANTTKKRRLKAKRYVDGQVQEDQRQEDRSQSQAEESWAQGSEALLGARRYGSLYS